MTYLIATLLLLAAPPRTDDRADQAIDDAIDLLQSRRAKLTEQAELQKLDGAIERLREAKRPASETKTVTRRVAGDGDQPADAPPKLASVKISDFIDHTERYKGQLVTLPLTVRSRALIPPGETLRSLAGGAARFQGSSEDGNRLDLTIDLPRSLEIPKLSFGDRALVTFRCTTGDLQRGNQAIEIRRPGQD
jgi:hypothetical protein